MIENLPHVDSSMWDGIQCMKNLYDWLSDEARCLMSWIRKKYLSGMIESSGECIVSEKVYLRVGVGVVC